MTEEKKFPTPSMVKAQERWDHLTEEEKEALLNEMREKIKRDLPSFEIRLMLRYE